MDCKRHSLMGKLLLGLVLVFAGQAQAVTILPLGDSITEGYGWQCSYRRPLVQTLFEDYGCPVQFAGTRLTPKNNPPHCKPTNTAHEGDSGKTVEHQIDPMVAAMNAQLVDYLLVHLGSNDMFYGSDTDTIIEDLELLIERAQSLNPDVSILLAGVIPWDPTWDVGLDIGHLDELQLSNELAAAIEQLVADRAEENIYFVDANSDFDNATMTYDGVHPNDSGEEFLAGRFLSVLNTLGVCANPTTAPFYARLENTDSSMCIEMPLASTDTGESAVIAQCSDVAHQWLSFDPVASLDNTYTIQFQHSQASNLCLDASSGWLTQEVCDEGVNQQFRIEVEGTRYRLSVDSLLAGVADNGQIEFLSDTESYEQRWQFDNFQSSPPADVCDPSVSSRFIANPGTWQLLSLPCTAPNGATMADLIDSDEIESDAWAAFYYQATGSEPGYKPIAGSDLAPEPDVGFWFISSETLTLRMPAGSLATTGSNALPCAAGEPCHQQTIDASSTWNLLGNPAGSNIRYQDIQAVNDSTLCSASNACKLDDIPDVNVAIYVFNGVNYQQLANTQGKQSMLIPWEAYWTILLADDTSALTINEPWHLSLREYPGQFMFVTNSHHAADLGGLAAADELCQFEARRAGLPGQYRAWLADATASPSTDWTTHNTDPYLRTDGQLIATGWDDLTDGALLNPIDKTATRVGKLPTDVWTNVNSTGSPASVSAHCNQWNSSAGNAPVGRTDKTDQHWSDGSRTRDCSVELPLYCAGQ